MWQRSSNNQIIAHTEKVSIGLAVGVIDTVAERGWDVGIHTAAIE